MKPILLRPVGQILHWGKTLAYDRFLTKPTTKTVSRWHVMSAPTSFNQFIGSGLALPLLCKNTDGNQMLKVP